MADQNEDNVLQKIHEFLKLFKVPIIVNKLHENKHYLFHPVVVKATILRFQGYCIVCSTRSVFLLLTFGNDLH